MNCTVKRLTNWSLALDLARATIGKEGNEKEPSNEWKRKLLDCQHSPLRAVFYHIRFTDLPYFVSVHLSRHKFGCEHFVSTQRTDRTAEGTSRSDLPQDAPVTHDIIANAQSLINISKKRLCNLASAETRQAWKKVVEGLKEIGEVEMADAMLPECEHRGGVCFEMKPCGKANMICWSNLREKITKLEREVDHWRRQALEEDALSNEYEKAKSNKHK
jgi:hypothetical protein